MMENTHQVCIYVTDNLIKSCLSLAVYLGWLKLRNRACIMWSVAGLNNAPSHRFCLYFSLGTVGPNTKYFYYCYLTTNKNLGRPYSYLYFYIPFIFPLAGLISCLGFKKNSKPNFYISTSRLYQFLLYQIACLCWLIVSIGSLLKARPIEIKSIDTLSFF